MTTLFSKKNDFDQTLPSFLKPLTLRKSVFFSSKKGPEEGERVERGHCHERAGDAPVHWYSSNQRIYLSICWNEDHTW